MNFRTWAGNDYVSLLSGAVPEGVKPSPFGRQPNILSLNYGTKLLIFYGCLLILFLIALSETPSFFAIATYDSALTITISFSVSGQSIFVF